MKKQSVFYSFHFDNDVMRVQQIRNIGALEGNEPVSVNRWEEIKKAGKASIQKWIDDNLKYKSCVIVLVGSATAQRPWVQYEIEKAWNMGKPIFGIYIHNIKCARNGVCRQGSNPFEEFNLNGEKLSNIVPCYNPNSLDAYNDIANNINSWIENAKAVRQMYTN